MSESAEARKPWAFIAHKDGRWAGLMSAVIPQKDLAKSLGEYVVDGFTITTVYDREGFDAALAGLKPWGES